MNSVGHTSHSQNKKIVCSFSVVTGCPVMLIGLRLVLHDASDPGEDLGVKNTGIELGVGLQPLLEDEGSSLLTTLITITSCG
uniref:Uncharacterized protein n=1 Tax=Lepeophtheirus salmonis TaxID=72036 RepID=A0A0K2SYE1_LEPSM